MNLITLLQIVKYNFLLLIKKIVSIFKNHEFLLLFNKIRPVFEKTELPSFNSDAINSLSKFLIIVTDRKIVQLR